MILQAEAQCQDRSIASSIAMASEVGQSLAAWHCACHREEAARWMGGCWLEAGKEGDPATGAGSCEEAGLSL